MSDYPDTYINYTINLLSSIGVDGNRTILKKYDKYLELNLDLPLYDNTNQLRKDVLSILKSKLKGKIRKYKRKYNNNNVSHVHINKIIINYIIIGKLPYINDSIDFWIPTEELVITPKLI